MLRCSLRMPIVLAIAHTTMWLLVSAGHPVESSPEWRQDLQIQPVLKRMRQQARASQC